MSYNVGNNKYDDEEIYEFVMRPVREAYYNEDNNYAVYYFWTGTELPESRKQTIIYNDAEKDVYYSTLSGRCQKLMIGIDYSVKATIRYSDKYKSYNFYPINVSALVPKTKEQQLVFLRSQVSSKIADALIDKYPNLIEDVIAGKEINPTDIKGVGEKTWNTISSKIEKYYGVSDLINLLSPLGFSMLLIMKINKYCENTSMAVQNIKNNPYWLTNIKGFGFKSVDKIAIRINPNSISSVERLLAYIKYYFFDELSNDGHTWCTIVELQRKINENIPECTSHFEQLINNERNNSMFLQIEDDIIGLSYIKKLEYNIINRLNKINENTTVIDNINIEKGIAESEKQQGFSYTKEQIEYIKQACKSKVVFISGLAGTGKTTILRALINIYERCSICCCALSAKAALRIKEATQHESSTIHSLFKINPSGKSSVFSEKHPLCCDMLIIDESSMINTELFNTIVSLISDKTKIVFCGDDGQLPPIGMGNPFYDILRLKQFNCCKLTKILRQAEKSGIISDSKIIRTNKNPLNKPEPKVVTGELKDMTYMFRDNPKDIQNISLKAYFKAVEQSGIENTIIITPCKQNKTNCTRSINNIIQQNIIDKTQPCIELNDRKFYVGDRVIQRKNVKIKTNIAKLISENDIPPEIYKNLNNFQHTYDLRNGDIGVVKYINKRIMFVEFENLIDKEINTIALTDSNFNDVELAYCLTVHVTQGSGYENVIAIIDNSHYTLLDSCMLYTALTRAKKKCLLVAQPSAFNMCIRNKASRRNTWLSLEYRNA